MGFELRFFIINLLMGYDVIPNDEKTIDKLINLSSDDFISYITKSMVESKCNPNLLTLVYNLINDSDITHFSKEVETEMTKSLIDNYLSHYGSPNNVYEMKLMLRLTFMNYVNLYIKSISDFAKEGYIFTNLFKRNLYKFNYTKNQQEEFLSVISNFEKTLQFIVGNLNFKWQNNFSSLVSQIAPILGTNLTDACSGPIPLASIILSNRTCNKYNISAINPTFLMSKESARKFNVSLDKKIINSNTDFSGQNLVFANKPCEGTIPLVRACKQNNTSYFIKVCDCPTFIESINRIPIKQKDLFSYLRRIDPQISSFGNKNFLFHLTGFESDQMDIVSEIVKDTYEDAIYFD